MSDLQQYMEQQALIDHLERYLGPLAADYRDAPPGERWTVRVGRFDRPPIKNCSAYVTLGLSDRDFPGRSSDGVIRIELYMILRRATFDLEVQGVLITVAQEMLRSGRPVLRGHVLGPRGPLWPGTKLEALYATLMTYMPEEFSSCMLEGNRPCGLIWLTPITRDEAIYARTHGYKAFEEALFREDPDLLVADRESMKSICAPRSV